MKMPLRFIFSVFGFVLFMTNQMFQVQAQADDTIRYVIISETRLSNNAHSYVEIANVGDEAVNLSSFELGVLDPWTVPYAPEDENTMMLPDVILEPGETWLIANVRDYSERHPEMNRTYEDVWAVADFVVHVPETTGHPEDSVAPADYVNVMEFFNGNRAPYLEYHVGGDSAVVDACINDIQAGTNRTTTGAKTIAGIPEASNTHVLVRKANVKQGNLDWEDARGNDLGDSEWMPIPFRAGAWDYGARYFTTIKHHGDAHLNEESVKSSTLDIDFENEKITVPWGIYIDSIMDEFELTGGIAWHIYHSPNSVDSTFNTPRVGDSLTIYACGNELEQIKFGLEVAPPTEDMALVFPRRTKGEVYWYNPFYVTENEPGMDSIGNIPFSTRIDTLTKYLEKAPEASWDFVWVDGNERVDLKRGDVLKITAEDGTQKDYYLAVDSIPDPSHEAHLAAITWPDVPDFLKEDPKWREDTIPGFRQKLFSYVMTVPYGTKTVPALVPHPIDINAQITVQRAKTLIGSVEDRTTTFTVAAEDDTTILHYSVLFKEELRPEDDQPFQAEPFISQVVFREFWGNNYLEIANPGNRNLDLSNYMFAMGYPGENPADIIQGNLATDSWTSRYMKYVPGYDYQDEENWQLQPGIIEKDFNVDPNVEPGDVFVIGRVENDPDRRPHTEECDIIINREKDVEEAEDLGIKVVFTDPAKENLSWNICTNWWDQNRSLCLFKILNDSIKSGTKPIGDPEDFVLIDLFGDFAGSTWSPGSDTIIGQGWNIKKKPQYWQGDTVPNGSFADTDEESPWEIYNANDYKDMGYGWPDEQIMLGDGVGAHPMDPTFVYVSTVSSYLYRVSKGYTSPQTIEGILTNTTTEEFLGNVFTAHEEQTLDVVSTADGAMKSGEDPLVNNDTLVVTSADGKNVTKYILNVSEEGLDDDAVLTAEGGTDYVIDVIGSEGTITGFEFGATVEEVLNNVVKPDAAIINVIDEDDNLVPLHFKNFDTVLVPTKATSDVYFEVVAENGITKIIYQLLPDLSESDAILYSNVYEVDQELRLVSLIPDNTNVTTLFTFLKPNEGASVKLVDKMGYERTTGPVAYDDEIIVTSPDGTVENVYYMKFLFEEKGKEAYVLSDVYAVDQTELMIEGVPIGTSISDFLSQLTPAVDATMTIVDADGNEVASGNMEEGYQLKVTSGDEKTVVVYDLDIVISVNNLKVFNIAVYPNPTTGTIYIEGLAEGTSVIIRNINGKALDIIDVKNIQNGTISLENKTAGTYFITIERGNYSSKTVRVIKR